MLAEIINGVIVVISVIGLATMLVLIVESVAAFFPAKKIKMGRRVPCTIIIPAHNEALVIEKTLTALISELEERDSILVVADNCSDETASLARKFDVNVLERYNEKERGKGYALSEGVNFLKQNPPDVIVIVDADCIVEKGAIDKLVRAANEYQQPVQCLYLMNPPDNTTVGQLVSSFAFMFKNHVRARGLYRLGGSVNLTGTGMAFTWTDISNADIANGNIVEDMALGVDFILKNKGPIFLEEARVYGELPTSNDAIKSQRTRWEHGHINTIQDLVPKIFTAALLKVKPKMFLNGLDLLIPPLSLLFMVNTLWLVMLALATAFFDIAPIILPFFITWVVVIGCVILTGVKFSNNKIPLSFIWEIPRYVISKLFIYKQFVKNKETKWIKTERK